MFVASADGSLITDLAAHASFSARADAARNAVKPQARGRLPCCGASWCRVQRPGLVTEGWPLTRLPLIETGADEISECIRRMRDL